MDAFDVLVGINLLREGLDIPEITLVAILDADKEGFLRTETSLIQTIGRAARNSEGHVIMYADKITESMEKAISETERRRQIQQEYNEEHGITPQTIKKAVRDLISISKAADASSGSGETLEKDYESMSRKELEKVKKQIEKNMHKAAAELNFEEAAVLRDKMIEVNKFLYETKTNPIQMTLSLLFSFYSNLMLTYYAPDKSEQGIANMLGLRTPWQARDYMVAMRKYSGVKTMQIVGEIRYADAKSKGVQNSSMTDGDILRELVFKILH